ncbi:MAG: radical SAM protein [Candidatus Aenigmatarchaeota archaeon]
MKILLVAPPASEKFPSVSRVPPLGLAYLAAVMEKNGHIVRIFDASVEDLTLEQIAEKILASPADVVGFTAMTSNYPQAERIVKLLKERGLKAPVVIGGSHATFMANDVLGHGFDFAVRGEGEQTFLELCTELQGGQNFRKIDGLSFKENGAVVNNPDRKFIQNLDELPIPAYHLINLGKYQRKAPPSNVRGEPWVSYSSSRGCPFGCFFCSVTHFWGRIWRGHSAKRVAGDIEYLVKKYGVKCVFFVDDNFTFRRERIIELCELLKEKNLGIEWSCSCRVDQVDEDLLRNMKSAGCWRIGFGIEAGTQKVLDWYGKKITAERAVEAIRMCRKAGISPFCFFILGAPIESEEDIKQTMNVMKKINADIVGISFLTPFPGSKLYEYVLENDLLLTKDFRDFAEDVPVIKGTLPLEKLNELSRRAYREFYFRPQYIISQLPYIMKNPSLAFRGFRTITGWVRRK